MSKNRNHNSILFLTTLGVYLGLVLTGGAAPQVYAHAAMARNFEIVDEIEFKDDLDTKPADDRSTINESVQVYLDDVEQFLAALERLARRGQFELSRDTFEVSQRSSLPCVAGNTAGSYTPLKFNNGNPALTPVLERLTKQLNFGYSLPDCVPDTSFNGKEACGSQFVLKLERSNLSLEVAVRKSSPRAAASLVSSLEQTFGQFKKQATPLQVFVIEHTTFLSTNDQVLVITHLPRAALDPLIAKDAQ